MKVVESGWGVGLANARVPTIQGLMKISPFLRLALSRGVQADRDEVVPRWAGEPVSSASWVLTDKVMPPVSGDDAEPSTSFRTRPGGQSGNVPR